ncbi:non-ribosomal peptide synthetase [Streptomyces sp. NBC_01754]|uniref:non-ribosomal peptide synthetase n=1 Tax=Streptomyces sp. NBC_01754 TaxID=2975930 RepID=UPI002DDBCFEC|nr:non-ribosomal peptide synthetase [Streptomyces sp. NBC_01754]WSC93391.1 non-ribosomal peptide synthetase [Streptomyces sp. NBC_01754]
MTGTPHQPFTHLGQLLDHQAALRPDAAALHAPGRRPTGYRQLRDRVALTGRTLAGLGVGRGSRVALVLPNGPELALAFLAVAAHATAAPLNPAYKEQEFAFYLDDMGTDALLVEEGSDSSAVAVAKERGIRIIELVPDASGPAGTFGLRSPTESAPAPRTGWAAPEETALILHTSGTTAQPKLVPLTHANLGAAAGNTRAAFALGGGDLCLNVMPLFHAHGLTSTLIAALAGGGGIVCTPGFSDSLFFDWLTEFRPTWYTAVPTMHQALLAAAGDHASELASSDLRFIRSASAPLPGPVLNALEDTFRAPVVEAYGMTEAGSLVTSNPLPPGNRKPGSVGIPVGGPVAVLDETGRLLGPGQSGEIAIRGANVTAGYEHNPEANRAAFTDGWFRTGDEGRLDEDGYLHIVGRSKELINRGGSKVSPAEVDDVLTGHPAVKTAVAFGLPHPTLGEDVAVAIVPHTGATVTEREIREFAAEHVAGHKVPSRVFLMAEVPTSPAGKVRRLKLAEIVSSATAGPAREPRGHLERRIAALWSEVLERDRIGPDENFFDLGGNSLLLARLSARLNDTWGRELPVVVLTMYPTVSSLAAHLAGEGDAEVTPGTTGSRGEGAAERGKDRLLRKRGLRKRTVTEESD